jgi:Transglycosylase SLT domain
MRVESRGQVKAVSPKGAIGLMQIMPDTWAGLRLRYRLGRDPRDPHDNILAGAAYLREMHDRFGAAGFLAAYNAGPGRYVEYVAAGRPLPAETRAYVAALAPLIGGDPVSHAVVIAAGATAWIRAPLFAVVADSSSSAHRLQSAGRLRARPVPISPGSNRRLVGIRATRCAAHRCSSRGLPAIPRTERRRSGVQILKR